MNIAYIEQGTNGVIETTGTTSSRHGQAFLHGFIQKLPSRRELLQTAFPIGWQIIAIKLADIPQRLAPWFFYGRFPTG